MSVIQTDEGRYEGEVYGDEPHGFGIMRYSNGSCYEGGWEHGLFHGYGKYSTSQGIVKYNCYINGSPLSQNQMIFMDEDGYIPVSSSDSKVEGFVIKVDPNGNHYEGQWAGCKRNGYGRLEYGDGKPAKDGFFYNGKFIGMITPADSEASSIDLCTLKQASDMPIKWDMVDGRTYIGEWEDGTFNGFGVLSDGKTDKQGYFLRGSYVGTVVDDGGKPVDRSFNGDVTVHYANGDLYEGHWNKSGRSGTGRLLMSNKGVYQGEWANNLKNGQGSLEFCDGCSYKGEFKDDLPDGKGLYEDSKSSYEGIFSKGIKNGEGTYTYPDGRICHGVWSDGQMNGSFRFYSAKNVNKFKGTFRRDRFMNEGVFYYEEGCTFMCVSNGQLFCPRQFIKKDVFLNAIDSFIDYIKSGSIGEIDGEGLYIIEEYRSQVDSSDFSLIGFDANRNVMVVDGRNGPRLTDDLMQRIDTYISDHFADAKNRTDDLC